MIAEQFYEYACHEELIIVPKFFIRTTQEGICIALPHKEEGFLPMGHGMKLDIDRIQASFVSIRPKAREIVRTFFVNLQKDDPDLHQLIEPLNIEQQMDSVIHTLSFIIDHLKQEQELHNYLYKLAAQSREKGFKEKHYESIGYTVQKTLAEFFQLDWTPALERHWSKVYLMITQIMKKSPSMGEPFMSTNKSDQTVRLNGPQQTSVELEFPEELTELIQQYVRESVHHKLKDIIHQQIMNCEEEILLSVKK